MPYPLPTDPSEPVEIVTVKPGSDARDPRLGDPVVEHEEIHTTGSSGIERHEHVVRDPLGVAHHEQSTRNRMSERMLQLAKAEQLVWLIVGLLDGLIALRVFLRLIGANPTNAFAQLIYGFTDLFLQPFFTLTGSPAAGRFVLEVPSLFAMLVYALIGWVVVRILWLLLAPTTSRSSTTYDRFRG